MAGASADGEMNYWPGFVDALSNLVLALVFVVVIFTLALAVISSKMAAEQAEREIERLRSNSVSEREKELLEEVNQLQALLAQMEKRLNLQVTSATAMPTHLETKIPKASGADIVFIFEPNAYELGGEALAKLNAFMKEGGSAPTTKMFYLIAIYSSGAYSQEKRSAYFRMIALRNALIGHGVPPENIVTRSDIRISLPGLKGEVRLSVSPKTN